MQIPKAKIDEILERTDLVALIGRHVELKRSGRTFKGLCPFHGEKTPSFHVNPERRHFKCFGCGKGGDAITFLRERNGSSFLEAAQQLAKEAGVTLEEREDPAAVERSRLWDANLFAARHFEDRLWNSPHGRLGREHLEERGVSPEVARLFGLGYAVNAWNDLCDRLVKEGILDWGARAGLIAPRRASDGFYDVFRGRLMIPIRSPEGRTIAFGARYIEGARADGEAGPKYLNSRESPVYRKSDTLYALDLAKDEIRRRKTAILVEGYFDVIGLVAAGVKNSVALCSTALTAGHLALLSRFDAQTLVLLLDGDSAGLKAVERLAGPLLSAGVQTRVATLPDGDDPDTFAMREGGAALDDLIAQAPPLSTHLLDRALPSAGTGFEEKMGALARLKPILSQMPAGMEKTVFLGQLAERLSVPVSEVKSHLAQEIKPAPRPAAREPERAAAAPATLDANEALFSALLIAEPALREQPEARFADEIRSVEVRLLLSETDPAQALAALSAPLRAPIERRLKEIADTMQEPDARRRALCDASGNLRLARIEEHIAEKTAELKQALEDRAEDEEIARLQLEHRQLNELKRRLESRRPAAGQPPVAKAQGSQS